MTVEERVAAIETERTHLATKADLGELRAELAALSGKVNLILTFIGAGMTALIAVGIRELLFG